MTEAGEGPRIEPKKLRGVKAEPNVEADHLESLLGIKFKRKPLKVPLTTRNRLALYTVNRGLAFAHEKSIKGRNDTVATYKASHQALFYEKLKGDGSKDRPERLNIYHENLHGFTDEINPEIEKQISTYAKEWAHMASTGSEVDRDILERGVVYKTFDEGVSEYGATEMDGIQRGYDMADPTSSHVWQVVLRPDYNSTIGATSANQEDLLKANIDRLKNHIDLEKYKLLQQGRDLGEIADSDFYDQVKLSGEHYFAGSIFVNEAMYRLRNSGLSRADALVFLIQHPPQSFDQLENPVQFTRQLLEADNK